MDSHVVPCVCSALYGAELEEEEAEEEEEQLELQRLPDLLLREAPQLLQYTAALQSRHDHGHGNDDDEEEEDDGDPEIQRERRGELRLSSDIGTSRNTTKKRKKYLLLARTD